MVWKLSQSHNASPRPNSPKHGDTWTSSAVLIITYVGGDLYSSGPVVAGAAKGRVSFWAVQSKAADPGKSQPATALLARPRD